MTDEEVGFVPTDIPTNAMSLTLAPRTLRATSECFDKRDISTHRENAAPRQIGRDCLDELIADFDKVHGQADPEAVTTKRARLAGATPHTDVPV